MSKGKGGPRNPKEDAWLDEMRNPQGSKPISSAPFVPSDPPAQPVVASDVPASPADLEERFTGVIAKLFGSKGYGFIAQDDLPGRDNNAFFRLGNWQGWKEGQRVDYLRKEGDQGYVAKDVKKMS